MDRFDGGRIGFAVSGLRWSYWRNKAQRPDRPDLLGCGSIGPVPGGNQTQPKVFMYSRSQTKRNNRLGDA